LQVTAVLFPGKSSRYPLNRRMAEPQKGPWSFSEEKKRLPLPGIKREFLGFSEHGPVITKDSNVALVRRDVKHIVRCTLNFNDRAALMSMTVQIRVFFFIMHQYRNCVCEVLLSMLP
jgi:hypothetical protein